MAPHIPLWAVVCAAVLMTAGVCAVDVARAADNDSPIGVWSLADGHGAIAIGPCGNALCGRIVGVDHLPLQPVPVDVHGQSLCGLTIITNERPDQDGTWGGYITDPRSGSTYDAMIWMEHGDLHLRGYVGIPLLGQTQVWRPFTGRLTPDCGMA